MPAYQTSLLLSKVASLVRASHPEVVVTFPNILGSKLSCSILMIIPIVFTCWSYFDTDGCVWEWGIPSKMVVLVGKMVINYIEIGYDKSTSSLLKWQFWWIYYEIPTSFSGKEKSRLFELWERPGHWDREDCGGGDVGDGDVLRTSVRFPINLVVQKWGYYLNKAGLVLPTPLSFINGMICWVDPYFVLD